MSNNLRNEVLNYILTATKVRDCKTEYSPRLMDGFQMQGSQLFLVISSDANARLQKITVIYKKNLTNAQNITK